MKNFIKKLIIPFYLMINISLAAFVGCKSDNVSVLGSGGMTIPPRWENIQGNPADSATLTVFTTNSVVSNSVVSWIPSVTRTSSNVVTLGYSDGPAINLELTNSPTTITFDLASYPTTGVSVVCLNLFVGTNTVAFTNTTIDSTTASALTISTGVWNDIFFQKGYGGTNFKAR